MRSNDEILESINSLRSQLGMEPKPEQQAPVADSNDVRARIAALNQKLSSTPMSRREFIEKRAADAAKSNTQTVFEFGEGMLDGISYIAKQGKDAAVEAFNEMSDGEVSMYGFGRGLADTLNVGGRDFYRFAKTLGGAAMDKLGGYTEEEEIQREYQRYIENFNYNTVVREKMLDQVENRAMVDFGANFVDPFMVFPVAKLGTFAARVPLQVAQKAATTAAFAARSKGAVNLAKFAKGAGKAVKAVDKVVDFAGHKLSLPTELAARVGARGTRAVLKGGAYVSGMGLKGVGMAGSAVEKVASLPRKGIAKLAEKVTGATGKGPGTAALTGQVTGAVAGVPGFFELGIAEGIGVLAKKMGKGLGEVASTFAQKGTNKRFLYRLATSDKVSEATRRKAMWAYNHFGTSVGDAAFNMLANGLSLGAINAGLSGLAGEDAKTSGAAFGSGALAGGFIPAGQRGMQGGKGDAARDQGSIDKYMKDKLGIDQRTLFQKLPKPAQLLISTLQESGIGAPGIRLLDAETYLQYLNEERAKKNIAPLTRAPAGHFATQEGVVYLNSDTINKAGDTGVEFVAHEVGHDFIHKALGNDPAMLELILERYKTTAEDPDGTVFYFQFDKEGNGIGDPIYLNKEATQVATDYNRKQAGIGVGRNASKLAQEIGADQFSMAFSKDPNIFKHIHPRLRRHLIDGARRVLTGGAMLEPATGNPLTNTISKQMQQNPAIKRLFTNYAKMRAFELDEKANLAKEGILIEPKKGQQGSDRYVELFGGIGLNLKDAKNLVVTNKGLIRELIRMRDQWKEEPSDGWSVRRGQLEGKTLTNDLRTLFTRSDQWGNVANIIDALQQAIDQRIGIRFGYRSGTKGKYQNPFRLRDVAIYGWQVGPMGGKGRASLKVLGYDQAVVRQNVQVLVDKGYIKDPDKFMQQLAEQGQAALGDPEGRINPEGRRENEIMTVAFGLKESSGQVASPGLRELLDSKAVNKSFRSYDVEALAGLTKGDSKAFAFNYDNIRDNYNPFRQTDQNLYAPQLDPKEVRRLAKVIKDNPDGFTINLQAKWADKGYVVAPEKSTEEFINTNNFTQQALEDYVYKHGDLFDLEGSHLGGWYDRKQDRYTLDVVFPIDNKQDAVEIALWGDQDAIFDLYNFEEIFTKQNGQPIIPEGIDGTLESILARKPNSNSTYAAEAYRRSESVREEGGSGVFRGTERAGEEAGQSQATQAKEEEIDSNLFLPQNDLTKFGAAQKVENSSGWLFPNGQFVRAPYSSHEVALGRFMDELPGSDPIKQKVAQAPGRTLTEKALSSGLMRVKKDGKDLFFQGNLTPKMKGFIEMAGIEYGVNAIHDNTARGSRDRSNIIYSPPSQALDLNLYIPAYHGTPHTFTPEAGAPFGRFRTDKIGTGEGWQEYGYGLYFATKREVAEWYRNELTDGSETKGSIYKVELAPKENEYLLWDKPLSEQPKGVREKLAKVPLERVGLEVEASPYDFGTAYFLKKIDGGRIGRVDSSTKTLADIKNLSVGNWMDAVGKTPQTSAALKEAGIPGIKYLDGSSRSKGKGDHNYVIFDESDVQITDRISMRDLADIDELDAKINRGAFKLLGFKAPKFQEFITAKGKPTFAKKDGKGYYTPTKWYHSGFIGSDAGPGKPSWTPDIKNSDPQAFFLTEDKNFAKDIFEDKKDMYDTDGSVYDKESAPPIELATNVSKVWDYHNPDHINLVLDDIINAYRSFMHREEDGPPFKQLESNKELKAKVVRSRVEKGEWNLIERAIDAIKREGFDSFLVHEDGTDNLGVFNPQDIKLIKDENVVDAEFSFNRTGEVSGGFDPENPDIRYMPSSEDLDAQIDRGAFKLLGHKAPKFQNFITANGEPTFAEKDSKGNYIPDKFYHSGFIGTTTPEYMTEKGADYAWTPDLSSKYNAFFLSTSKKFAENFMEQSDDVMSQVMMAIGKEPLPEYSQKPPPPIELATNVSKVWDFRNPDHVDLVIDDKSTRKHIMSGDWETIERFLDKIKKLGFDSFLVREDGVDNLGVFNPENVKLLKDEKVVDATLKFNRVGEVAGSFDPNNPDLRFMPALEDAKALVEQRGRVAEAAEETFFGKMLPEMLRKVGGQLKPSTGNIREAARRAIKDTEVFLKENPQFADYYKADMEAVRTLLKGAYESILDDEMLYYRLTLGLTSPGTSLPANVGDGLNIFNLKKQDGNLDKIKLGESAKGNVVITESPFEISGTTAPTKARALKIVDRLEKEKGGIRQAVEFLEEAIPMNELHKFKQEMGYKGKVGKPGDVKRIVKAATGQDKLIPRMFIFGPKVGAYTLNAIGRHNYNTIDVWEARFIRSYFKGMFSKNTGLPANVDEHALMTRFTEMFQEEYNRMTGQNLETSALQALRWFYMIDTAKKLGYTGASTNETISGYTERYLTRLGLNQASGGQSNAAIDGGVSAQAGPAEQQLFPQQRQLNRVASRPARPQVSNRFMMMPAAARAAVAQGETLERFRN